jgi:outer membrane protein, multidrug efflux system
MNIIQNSVNIRLAILICALLAASCHSSKKIEEEKQIVTPTEFNGIKDSANSANMNWKSFFTDSYLLDLIDTALEYNWDIQIAYQRIQEAQSDVLLANSALKPKVAAGASGGVVKFGEYTMDGAGNKNTLIYNDEYIPKNLPQYNLGLQTSWELDIWGKLRSKKKAAATRFLASMEGKNIVLTNLISDIAINYYELLALDQSLNIVSKTIELQKNALEVVKIQKEAAVTNELAVKQFEAQVLHLEGLRLQILQHIAKTENNINRLTGSFPRNIRRQDSLLTKQIPQKVELGIPSNLLQNRPDIRQAEFDLIASKADVKSAKAAFYPSLNIDGSLGFQAFKAGLLFVTPESIAFTLFGNLTAPIINRASIKSAFNLANAKQLEALYNYEKTIVNGYIEVYNEVLTIKNLEQALVYKTREVDVLTQSIETSGELFKTGRANYLEVLITQQNALQSKLELVETKKNQFIASVNIYKALGGGWQ